MKLKIPERLKKPGYKILGAVFMGAILLTSPKWGRAALREMEYFRIHTLEIKGTIFLQPSDVVSRLRVDTLRSLFDDLDPLLSRLHSHPQILDASIRRKPPGTLVVTIAERQPIALVPSADGLVPYDSGGRALPIDPARMEMDLPVVRASGTAAASPALLNMIGVIRASHPGLYERLSQVQRTRTGDVILVFTPHLRVRTNLGVATERLKDIFPVEADLSRRNERVLELDLRFKDQVIARLEHI